MRKRSKGRECALKILYQSEIARRDIKSAIDVYWSESESPDEVVKKFSSKIALGVEKNLEAIDEKVTKYGTNWQIKRMAVIDRNILRMGVFELLFAGDIPPKVAINEAVELAKKYGDVDSSKFVNGILDKIHKVEVTPNLKVVKESHDEDG